MKLILDSGTTSDRQKTALLPYQLFYDTSMDVLFIGDGTTLGGIPFGGNLAVNVQTGTSYTLQASDNGTLVYMTAAAANAVTVPAGLTGEFHIAQGGAGQTTVVAGGGVTINSSGTLLLRAQYSMAALFATSVDTYLMIGDAA